MAVAVTPVKLAPLPMNEPLNEPECDNPVAPVVAVILPLPLIVRKVTALVPSPTSIDPDVRVDAPVPPLGTVKAVVNDSDVSSAADPETITFFQLGIISYDYK